MNINELKSRLEVDFELGLTFWNPEKRQGSKVAGKRAGCRVKRSTDHGNPKFYRCLYIDKKQFFEHRIIAALYGWDIAGMEVDHINGNSEDNRIDNLRVVTRQENCKNIKKARNNTSGVPGVYWDKSRNKWRPSISINGKNKCLGRFDNFEDAVRARKIAEKAHGYHEKHGLDR